MSLQGTIETFAIADVLRLLAATNKSGRLQVQGPSRSGTVWVDGGKILAAESPNTPHAEAAPDVLFQLLRFDQGSFRFELDRHPTQTIEPVEIEAALHDAEAMVSEWRELESSIPSLESWVSLRGSLPDGSVTITAEQWKGITAVGSGRSVSDLGDVLSLGELPTYRAVSQLLELGVVDVGDKPASAASPATTTASAPATGAGQADSTAPVGVEAGLLGDLSGDLRPTDDLFGAPVAHQGPGVEAAAEQAVGDDVDAGRAHVDVAPDDAAGAAAAGDESVDAARGDGGNRDVAGVAGAGPIATTAPVPHDVEGGNGHATDDAEGRAAAAWAPPAESTGDQHGTPQSGANGTAEAPLTSAPPAPPAPRAPGTAASPFAGFAPPPPPSAPSFERQGVRPEAGLTNHDANGAAELNGNAELSPPGGADSGGRTSSLAPDWASSVGSPPAPSAEPDGGEVAAGGALTGSAAAPTSSERAMPPVPASAGDSVADGSERPAGDQPGGQGSTPAYGEQGPAAGYTQPSGYGDYGQAGSYGQPSGYGQGSGYGEGSPYGDYGQAGGYGQPSAYGDYAQPSPYGEYAPPTSDHAQPAYPPPPGYGEAAPYGDGAQPPSGDNVQAYGSAAYPSTYPAPPLSPSSPPATEPGAWVPPAPNLPEPVAERHPGEAGEGVNPPDPSVGPTEPWAREEVTRARMIFESTAPPPPPPPPIPSGGPVWPPAGGWLDGPAPERIAPPPPPPPPPGGNGPGNGREITADGGVFATSGGAPAGHDQGGYRPDEDAANIERQLMNLSERAREAVKRSSGLFDGRTRR